MTSIEIIKARRKRKIRRALFIASFITIPLLQFLFFMLYPNIDTLILSFKRYDSYNNVYDWVWFENYTELFNMFKVPGSPLGKAIRNSLLFFVVNDFVILPISFFSAFFMYKKMPFANAFRVLFFIPSIISVVVLTMLYTFMFDSSIGIFDKILTLLGMEDKIPILGWLGDKKTALPIVLFYCIWSGLGSNVVLMSGAMSRLPTEMIEAGKLDGITLFKEMIYVTFPLTGSLLATLMMMGVPVIFTFFLQPMLITNGGPDRETYTIAMYIVNNIKTASLTLGATVGVLCALVGTPLVIILRKLVEKLFPVYEY